MEVNVTLLIQLVLFLSLLGFLSKFLFSPMLSLFEERERRIDGAKQEAADLNRRAQLKLEEVEARIAAAQKEAKQALLTLQAEGAKFHREVLDAAREGSQKRLKEAGEDLKTQIEVLRAQLMPLETDLSGQLLERLLGQSKTAAPREHSHA